MTPGLVALAAAPLTREDARDAARQELSRPAYHRDDPGLAEQALRTVGRWVGALFDRAAAASPGGGAGAVLLLVLLVLVVAAVRRRTGALLPAATGADPLRPTAAAGPAEHRRAAADHAAGGRYAEALRDLLRGIAREGETRGLLAPRAGRTAEELAVELGSALPKTEAALGPAVGTELGTELARAARAFDEVWYGGRRAGPEDYAVATAADRALQNAVGSRSHAGVA